MLSAEKHREKALQGLLNKLDCWITQASMNGKFLYVWTIPLDVPRLVVTDIKIELEKCGFDVEKPTEDNLVISW